MKPEDEAAFDAFAAAVMARLRRLAYAWCRDWHRADDLVQSALERVYAAWPRIRRADDAFAYTRTVMVRLLISEQRRPGWRREVLHDALPESGGASPDHAGRLDLVSAVGLLPPKQRAVVLLRYVEDLPIREVAALLGCSEGTVKSQSHAAMDALRTRLSSDSDSHSDTPCEVRQ